MTDSRLNGKPRRVSKVQVEKPDPVPPYIFKEARNELVSWYSKYIRYYNASSSFGNKFRVVLTAIEKLVV